MNSVCLRWHEIDCTRVLKRYGLRCTQVAPGTPIPGSYWGGCEAGLVADIVYVRDDTPLHSVLHETAHYVCMTAQRRAQLNTDAGSSDIEEAAVCYLQLRLAEHCGVPRARLYADMDAWGYSFRLGDTQSWFEQDAQDARDWLQRHRVLGPDDSVTWHLRS